MWWFKNNQIPARSVAWTYIIFMYFVPVGSLSSWLLLVGKRVACTGKKWSWETECYQYTTSWS